MSARREPRTVNERYGAGLSGRHPLPVRERGSVLHRPALNVVDEHAGGGATHAGQSGADTGTLVNPSCRACPALVLVPVSLPRFVAPCMARNHMA